MCNIEYGMPSADTTINELNTAFILTHKPVIIRNGHYTGLMPKEVA